MNWWKKNKLKESNTGALSHGTPTCGTEHFVAKQGAQSLQLETVEPRVGIDVGLTDSIEFKLWEGVPDATDLRHAHKPYVVPKGYKISGHLFCRRRKIVIDGEIVSGRVEGRVVMVSPGGVARGRIEAWVLRIAGYVNGVVRVRQGVEVSSRGELSGSVLSPAVGVSSGAKLRDLEVSVG
jgi:cytoskeletal protein CcmA (bactofilin family)